MEFTDFYQWVYREMGMSLNSYKEIQLNRRIKSLMDRLNIKTLEEFKNFLAKDKKSRAMFLDYVTINVTEFFRNPEFFKALGNTLEEKYKMGAQELKIWSAGCSCGCEPYSLSMLIQDISSQHKFKIYATDIDENMLSRAKEGKYTKVELGNIEDRYLNNYLKKINDDEYVVRDNVKKNVVFKKHDMILDDYDTGFDLIVCRNVVIYFKDETKQQIVKGFVNSLKVGGVLFVGATESINSYKELGLEKVSPFIYRKV